MGVNRAYAPYGYVLRENSHIENSHIDNITQYGVDTFKIGNRYWISNDLDEFEPDEGLGNLIWVLSYHNDDKDSRFYGEKASLWIYNIENIKQETGLEQDSIYNRLSIYLTKDSTSIWSLTDKFQPFIALKTKPRAIYNDSSEPIYEENIIIFANNRIYRLNFSNEMVKAKGQQALNMFDKRCLSIAHSIDLKSYKEREIERLAEEEIQEKEFRQEALLIRIIYAIITLCGILALIFSLRMAEKKNIQARRWIYYIILSTSISVIAMGIGMLDSPTTSDIDSILYIFYIPAIIINVFLCLFFAKKANEDNNSLYLIPKWLSNNLIITNEFRTRLLMVLLVYPFFVIVPLPFIGLLFLLFYILPIIPILGIIWVVMWVKEGKKIDVPLNIHNDKVQLYCRHCGKLIDADSKYCRYCGKKL